jgi:chemotaxis protein methyltransferase CheR
VEGIIRKGKVESIEELVKRLENLEKEAMEIIVDAMTTNETSFFRDGSPFEAIKTTILPDLIERNRATRTLNIWSAACSRGQEPVSLAMMIRDNFPELATWNVKILATDISETVLEQCKSGIYTRTDVGRGLPAQMMVDYFQKCGLKWQVRPIILDMIEYKQMNLIEPFPVTQSMDLILIRNVLIYFDDETKVSIQKRLGERLKSNSYMMLGTAEIMRLEQFERVVFDTTSYYKINY